MCFSATASFTAAAVLIPTGLYTVRRALNVDPKWVPLAAYPALFGIQQMFEGFVWLGFNNGDQARVYLAGLGFSFFAHCFWLAWVPFSAYWLERGSDRRPVLLGMMLAGVLFGLSIFLPQIFMPGWLSVRMVQYSVLYDVKMIYDGTVGHAGLRAIYALIILGSLLLSRQLSVRLFAALIAASLMGTSLFYASTFISVWCFFAAILSLYLVVLIERENRQPALAR